MLQIVFSPTIFVIKPSLWKVQTTKKYNNFKIKNKTNTNINMFLISPILMTQENLISDTVNTTVLKTILEGRLYLL